MEDDSGARHSPKDYIDLLEEYQIGGNWKYFNTAIEYAKCLNMQEMLIVQLNLDTEKLVDKLNKFVQSAPANFPVMTVKSIIQQNTPILVKLITLNKLKQLYTGNQTFFEHIDKFIYSIEEFLNSENF